MGEAVEIGVRYCGGCNPRYDRVALVESLVRLLPEHHFTSARQAEPYSAVLVVCGCTSRCASVTGLQVPPGGLLYVCGWEDLPSVQDTLQRLSDAPHAQPPTPV